MPSSSGASYISTCSRSENLPECFCWVAVVGLAVEKIERCRDGFLENCRGFPKDFRFISKYLGMSRLREALHILVQRFKDTACFVRDSNKQQASGNSMSARTSLVPSVSNHIWLLTWTMCDSTCRCLKSLWILPVGR